MAFNPFHKFRKHKKVIFAALTIFCMFSFVLCSGVSSGGDMASWFTQKFLGRAKRDEVAKLDGSGVTATDLMSLRRQRIMANSYMFMATVLVMDGIQQELQSRMTAAGSDQQATRELQAQLTALQEFASRAGGGLYFGGNPKYPETELLDFMIWQQEAKRLGIKLSDDDVSKEIRRLTLGRFSSQQLAGVFAAFQRPEQSRLALEMRLLPDLREVKPYFNEDVLRAALRQELEVRIAQEALGYEPGGTQPDGKPVSPVAAAFTPQEFWSYFEDNVKKVDVSLIPVKVEDFVAKVTDKPTDQEIKDLYAKYRDKLADANSATPGFKQPRRVQVEWVGAKHDAPEFKRLAAEFRKASGPAITVAAALGEAAMGNSSPILVAANLTAVPSYEQRRLLVTYQYARQRESNFLTPFWVGEGFLNPPSPLHESSWQQPAGPVALIGVNFGTLGTPAGPFAALAAFEAAAVQKEMADRVRFGSTLILNGTMAAPLPVAALAVGLYGSPSEQYLPFDRVKDIVKQLPDPEYREKLELKYLREARNRVFDTMKKEIADINKAKDQKMLDAYIADKIERYGLEHGQSADPGDDYTTKFRLGDDPALKPLKEAFSQAPSMDPTGNRFGQELLGESRFTPPDQAVGVYKPQGWPADMWSVADQAFLYWLTKDMKEEVVRLDDPKRGKQVWAEVAKAWRFNKARELAKKEADKILEEARKEQGNKKGLRDLGKRTVNADLIELDPMGRFNRQPGVTGLAVRYQQARIPDTKVPHVTEAGAQMDPQTGRFIPPPKSFAEKVVDLRKEPKGSGAVLADNPEEVYYVAVLTNIEPPSDKEFYEAYRDAASQAKNKRDPLFTDGFEPERRRQYKKELMERLRKDAKLEINEDAMKKFGGGSGGAPLSDFPDD